MGFRNFLAYMIVALAVLAPAASNAHPHRFGHFSVKTRRDSFTGVTTCTAKAGEVFYRDGVVSFRFDGPATGGALVRLNAGPVIQAENYRTEIRSKQLFDTSGPLDNPDDGFVRLPAVLIKDATFADIRPNPGKRQFKHFDLKGLAAAINFMEQQGCPLGDSN